MWYKILDLAKKIEKNTAHIYQNMSIVGEALDLDKQRLVSKKIIGNLPVKYI